MAVVSEHNVICFVTIALSDPMCYSDMCIVKQTVTCDPGHTLELHRKTHISQDERIDSSSINNDDENRVNKSHHINSSFDVSNLNITESATDRSPNTTL